MRYKAGGWNDDGWDRGEPMRPDLIVDEPKRVNTGLVTAAGQPIYRVPDPIGFGRR